MAAKGKPAAKGAVATPEVAINADGAKFATVRLGTQDHPITMLVNLNCPVDIIMDNVKRLMIKKLDAAILGLQGPQKTVLAATIPTLDPVTEGSVTERLKEIKAYLNEPDATLDLVDDNGLSLNCKDVLQFFNLFSIV